MKKLIAILCLIVVPAIAQKMPQKTFYTGEIEVGDTIGGNQFCYMVRTTPSLTYYYNGIDSVCLTPICYIPKQITETQYPYIYGFQIDVFKEITGVKEGSFKIKTEQCNDLPAEYTAELIKDNPPVYNNEYGATMMYFKMDNYYFNLAVLCGTKEIELTINGKIIVPKQNREVSDYLTKVNEHINWMVIK